MASLTFEKIIVWIIILIAIAVIALGLFSPKGLYSKVVSAALSVGEKFMPAQPQEGLRADESLASETNTAQKKFMETIEQFPEKGPCIFSIPSLTGLQENRLEVITYQGINTRIEKPTGEQGGLKLSPLVTKDKDMKACVISPKAFYSCYLETSPSKKNCQQPAFSDASQLFLTKDKLLLGAGSFDVSATLFKPDAKRVCFIPTHEYTGSWNPVSAISGWGCDAADQTLDSECIALLQKTKTIKACGEA